MNSLHSRNSEQSLEDEKQNENASQPKTFSEKMKNSDIWKKFRFNSDNSPPEIFNITLYCSICVFGILGCMRGLDEGYVSSVTSQESFKTKFGLNDETKSDHELDQLKSNIKSMVLLGSIGGSMLSIYMSDYLGRVRTLQFSCIFLMIGAAIQTSAKTIGQLYAGRLIEGLLGVGLTVVCGPVYLSEVAPKSIRGLAGNLFAGSVYLGIMLGYFSNLGTVNGFNDDDDNQWMIPTSMKIIVGGLMLIASFLFCIESPRWLIKKGKLEQALKNFSKLRHLPEDHPYILSEISDINEQLAMEYEATKNTTLWGSFKELFGVYSNRYRICMCIAIQVLSQWSGASTITMYAPELFSLVGKSSKTDKMFMTAMLGVVKFTSAYLSAFFIIDFLGRRKSLYIGLTLQALTMLYFATFMTIVPEAVHDFENLSPSEVRASEGALASLYLNGVAWTCGWNAIQYLINSEVLPLSVRNLGTALIMTFHFANQYACSKAMPTLLSGMGNDGTFYFFFAVVIAGLFFTWFFVPEVSGRSLESMEDLFNLPWYLIGRRGNELAPDHSEVGRIHAAPDHSGNAAGGDIIIDMKAETNHVETGNSASPKV